MHTAICTFEDRAQAEQAVERLAQAGFGRDDIHLEHRHADGTPIADADSSGKPGFFQRLFGGGRHAAHAERYAGAVERGFFVVLVESADEAQATRAQDVLHGLNPADADLVHRAGQPPLRDVVAERQAGSLEQAFGTARGDMGTEHNASDGRGKLFPPQT